MMDLPETPPGGGSWDERVLVGLGATRVAWPADGPVTVDPDIDLTLYAAAAAVSALARARSSALGAAQAHYDGLIAAGFTWHGVLFQIDAQSRASIVAMSALAGIAASQWPVGFSWIAADNSLIATDATGMIAFGAAVVLYVSGCVLRLRAIKTSIAAAADSAAVAAIDVTDGYPAEVGP